MSTVIMRPNIISVTYVRYLLFVFNIIVQTTNNFWSSTSARKVSQCHCLRYFLTYTYGKSVLFVSHRFLSDICTVYVCTIINLRCMKQRCTMFNVNSFTIDYLASQKSLVFQPSKTNSSQLSVMVITAFLTLSLV